MCKKFQFNKLMAFLLAFVMFLVPLNLANIFASDFNDFSYATNVEFLNDGTYQDIEAHGPLVFKSIKAAAEFLIGRPAVQGATRTTFTSLINGVRRTVEFSNTVGEVTAHTAGRVFRFIISGN